MRRRLDALATQLLLLSSQSQQLSELQAVVEKANEKKLLAEKVNRAQELRLRAGIVNLVVCRQPRGSDYHDGYR